MPKRLQDFVSFHGDRLFNGAVNINWFNTDAERSRLAAESFVFHGPEYHGVKQTDIGTSHGHLLQDTANFVSSIVNRCYGLEDYPFTLAIAGYGTGKSHLGLTLAELLNSPDSILAKSILSALEASDVKIGNRIRNVLKDAAQPCLVVALNGMSSFDLSAEIMRQILHRVRLSKCQTQALENLRPRFRQAARLIEMSNELVIKELLTACDETDIQKVIESLGEQDEHIYKKVHAFFEDRGMPIRALGAESVKDIIDITVREYCGHDKAFRCLVIFFDEFGRYTEFATVKSQIAGSGVLQDLFEGIQANSGSSCFVGFIQFELNAYVQRVATEHRNEILRYVTRYQAATRVYLSTNIETLIAHLLEKRKPKELDHWFDNQSSKNQSKEIANNIAKWFPQAQNHRLWTDHEQFHVVIRKGCWPLSAYTTWMLFYLAAAGKHLQERSALALLGDAFNRYKGLAVSDNDSWVLHPVDLWSDDLQHELITAEETGQQGSITHSYASVIAQHETRLGADLKRILQAIVLSSKMGLQVDDRDESITVLSVLAGLKHQSTDNGIKILQEEYNVLEWDEAFKAFDILGDAVPRTQFLAFLRQRVASTYDESGKSQLFASKATQWCDLLQDLECDFAEENKITTKEWRYHGVTANVDLLPMQIKLSLDRWLNAFAIDEPRGTIIYCYVDQSRDPTVVKNDTMKLLRTSVRGAGMSIVPIIVWLLCDEDGSLGQALAELSILEEAITEEDRVRFGNLIGAHREKMIGLIRSHIEEMIRQRRYATCLNDDLESHRLSRAGTELFSKVYKSPIPFPFDGFSTARGNAADSCQELTIELFQGRLDYDAIVAKPSKTKNRALHVLHDTWRVFTKNGNISKKPNYPTVRNIMEKWDKALESDQKLLIVGRAIREICHPPYGANIASAGMLLGLFIAPRIESLSIVHQGQQLSTQQWLQEGAFRGKFLDLLALDDVELILTGETSSEWESLFDEWEQAETYFERKECLRKSSELKQRIPVPSVLTYRLLHLQERSDVAIQKIRQMEEKQNDALDKIENAIERRDISNLSWGAASLQNLKDQMAREAPMWTEHQIMEMEPQIGRARQAVVHFFDTWLLNQAPRGDGPEVIGNFKHRMLHQIGGNLRTLSLDEQYNRLEARTNELIRNAETAADARHLIRDVRSWLSQHENVFRLIRIAELRGLLEHGNKLSAQLQGMDRRIEMAEIAIVRTELADFISKLKKAELEIKKRASHIWQAKLRSKEELDTLLEEINSLMTAYEGCQIDLDDLRLLRRALHTLQSSYNQLQDDRLTWQEFEQTAQRLLEETESTYSEEELPWKIDITFHNFIDAISKERKQASLLWIDAIESEVSNIANMSVAEANRLLSKANNQPALLTDQHINRLSKVKKQIEAHLESLALEWLLEKFRELPKQSKQKFIEIASEILNKR